MREPTQVVTRKSEFSLAFQLKLVDFYLGVTQKFLLTAIESADVGASRSFPYPSLRQDLQGLAALRRRLSAVREAL